MLWYSKFKKGKVIKKHIKYLEKQIRKIIEYLHPAEVTEEELKELQEWINKQ